MKGSFAAHQLVVFRNNIPFVFWDLRNQCVSISIVVSDFMVS